MKFKPHFSFFLLGMLLFPAYGFSGESNPLEKIPVTKVELGGDTLDVRWVDGDSFISASKDNKIRTRIIPFNTLESYGPVHRWGTWTPSELLQVAVAATAVARSQTWSCSYVKEGLTKKKDGSGRYLVRCDDLAKELLGLGLAHLLIFKGNVADGLLEYQHKAMEEKKGMWSKGIPSAVLTSLHSKAEKRKNPEWLPYNRTGSTRTGYSLTVSHDTNYETCQEVCMRGSCLLYVPYEQRYGHTKAPCLLGE